MGIKDKVITILSAHCDMENISQYLHENDDLTKLGMNSITFISMVVNLESEFGFEFEDEALDYNKFTSLNLLCGYVEEQMQINNVVYLPKEVDMSIKIDLAKIIAQYTDSPKIKQTTFSNLLALELSQLHIQSIMLDIQERYGIVLNEEIIDSENLFDMDNLCKYISINIKE